MPTTRTRRIAARIGVLAAALAIAGASTAAVGSAQETEPSAPPSPTAEPASQPAPEADQDEVTAASPQSLDALELSASLDKDEYESGDQVTITLALTNTGDEPLGTLTGWPDGDLRVSNDAQLQELYNGFTLAPDETFETSLTGYMRDVADGSFDYRISISGPPDDEGFSDSKATTLSAPVTVTTGTYSGEVYADKNDNGEFDDGEELSDVTVKLSDTSWDSTEATTGDDGAFAFEDITTGRYQVEFQAPGGWYVTQTTFHVQVTTDGVHEVFPAVRPLSERLEAIAEFGASSYRIDDTVSLAITLTNTGRSAIKGIEAHFCNGPGHGNLLTPDSAGWGPLQVGATGVSLEAGETKVIEVTDDMPSGVDKYGFVGVECSFTSPTMGIHYGGPGISADVKIVDQEDDNGSGSDGDSGSDDDNGSGSDGDGSGAGDGSDGDGGSASGGSSGSAEDDLALTGFGGMDILWIGLATLAAGALALWYARRRRTSTEAGELG